MRLSIPILVLSDLGGLWLLGGCKSDAEIGNAFDEADGSTSNGSTGDGDADGTGDGDGDGDGDGPKLDVDPGDTGGTGGPGGCTVDPDGQDAPPPCEETAPPESFDPDVQWDWWGPEGTLGMRVTPAVANLTDDDDNGQIDLCDVPDVIALTGWGSGHLHVLDGETGEEHWKSEIELRDETHPAVGDIDGDGIPEIVAMTGQTTLVAFEHDGTLKWQSPDAWAWGESNSSALGLADLDNDGDVEILAGHFVFDHEGKLLFQAPGALLAYSATTAADLDDDGDLEVIVGAAAWHHDGTAYWQSNEFQQDWGYSQVADLDEDGRPEVLFMPYSSDRVVVFEHDGTVKYNKPNGSGAPVTIHDFDGDGKPEFTSSVGNTIALFEADATMVWQKPKPGGTWSSSGTGFDFLGDGSAEVVTGDAQVLQVLDGLDGDVLLQVTRTSGTGLDFEVVADVDNDGSAEIIVQGSTVPGQEQSAGSIQVIRDKGDRWVPARRIWNQHTYHVTNVNEDGTIPQFEPPHWKNLNTFRTQAQVEGGGVCKPEPEG